MARNDHFRYHSKNVIKCYSNFYKKTWLDWLTSSSHPIHDDSKDSFFSIHTIHDDSQDSLFRFMRFIMTRKTLFFDSCDSSWLERLFGRVINQRVMWLDWSSIVCMTRPSLSHIYVCTMGKTCFLVFTILRPTL